MASTPAVIRRSAALTSAATHELTSARFAYEVQQRRAALLEEAVEGRANMESCVWTVGTTCPCVQAMDEETRELIQRLCTKAGMIMEDSSAEAISLQAHEAKETYAKLLRLSAASETSSALIAAAKALSRFP